MDDETLIKIKDKCFDQFGFKGVDNAIEVAYEQANIDIIEKIGRSWFKTKKIIGTKVLFEKQLLNDAEEIFTEEIKKELIIPSKEDS